MKMKRPPRIRQAPKPGTARMTSRALAVKGNAMSILSTLSHIATGYRAARIRYLTERAILALPAEMRKDIGWPDAYDFSTGRRRHDIRIVTGR
jgi:hypothetical protein